jgi:Fe-S-cluster containining protein
MARGIYDVDPGRPETWIKYRDNLCDSCSAGCCSLPVELTFDDLIRMELVDEFEKGESPRKIAKRLKKEGFIRLFNLKSGVFTLEQLANEDCVFLDQKSRRCTVYEKRPETCRQHPAVGPRPGFCAYRKK